MAVEIVEQLFEALGRGDAEAAERLLSDDLGLRFAGTSRYAGEHTGRDEVLRLLADLAVSTGIVNVVERTYDGPDSAIVHQRGSAAGYQDESLLHFRVVDGRIAQITEFLFDVNAFDSYVDSLA